MMEHYLAPPKGARRNKRRVGRGDGSGRGSYSGRGMKGQKSRSGKGPRPGFEGGQLPLIKRLSKRRGFTNIFKKRFSLVKLEMLNRFPENAEVTPERLAEMGLVDSPKSPVKVLGNGELSKPLTVVAHKFTRSAQQKIVAAGGSVREL